MEQFECYYLEFTGKYTSFHDGISSPVYKRKDNGALEQSGWGDHPDYQRMKPGAMWMEQGIGLVVRTPGGDWHIDGTSRTDGKWTRDGVPPKITVTPSILFAFTDDVFKEHGIPMNQRKFHGVLENGILREVP